MHDFLKLRLNVAIIFITKDNNNFNPSFDCYVSDSARPRMSQDKITDTRGNHLIDICVGNQLRILNGRLAGDSFRKFSCHTYNGSSTVVYVIVSEPLLFEIPLFQGDQPVNREKPFVYDC